MVNFDQSKKLSITQMKIIFNQIEKSICKIIFNDKLGTGFFCRISCDNNLFLNVLIVSSILVNKNDILQNKKLNFSLDNDKINYSILLNESRIIYINEISTIIEIKQNDKFNINYLEIDDSIYKNNNIEIYIKKSIYSIYYSISDNYFSFGEINRLNQYTNEIFFSCEYKVNSLGFPILDLSNFKVIGISLGKNIEKNTRIGISIKVVVEDFIKYFKKKNLNIINISENKNTDNFNYIELKKVNDDLKEKIRTLKYELEQEKIKNKKLEDEINKFKKIYNKEKFLEDYPQPITIGCTTEILHQMKNCICKIYKNNGENGTGFFCKINYQNKLILTLITNNHIINNNYIKANKLIKITINNDKENKDISFNNRKIISNEKLDITIIELFERDKINNYLELDNNIFTDNSYLFYQRKSIYDIHYPKRGESSVSFGLLKEIKEDDSIIHLCNTQNGSSGSPILNLTNNKVIAIHLGGSKDYNFNEGSFLKKPIIEYINKITNSNNNKIVNNNIINNNYNYMMFKNIINPYNNIVNNNKINNNSNLSYSYNNIITNNMINNHYNNYNLFK